MKMIPSISETAPRCLVLLKVTFANTIGKSVLESNKVSLEYCCAAREWHIKKRTRVYPILKCCIEVGLFYNNNNKTNMNF